MNKTVAAIRLMAKAATFFAQCNTEYSEQERKFIDGFVSGIDHLSKLDESLHSKMFIKHVVGENYALDHIVAETLDLLDSCNESERRIILYTIDDFIKTVIHLDSTAHRAEQMNYDTWRREVGLEQD
jgi:hypothetical protein